MTEPTIVLVSDDPAFAPAILNSREFLSIRPTVTVISGAGPFSSPRKWDLAIVGPLRYRPMEEVVRALQDVARVVLCLLEPGDFALIDGGRIQASAVFKTEGWERVLAALAAETVLRLDAEKRLQVTEEAAKKAEQNAALGSYMLDMRHSINNALTSILGNVELLLMNREGLNAEDRAQLETIHAMSLKMHEILYRFSSIENEFRFASGVSHSEMDTPAWVPMPRHG